MENNRFTVARGQLFSVISFQESMAKILIYVTISLHTGLYCRKHKLFKHLFTELNVHILCKMIAVFCKRIHGCSCCVNGLVSQDEQVSFASAIIKTRFVLGSFSAW